MMQMQQRVLPYGVAIASTAIALLVSLELSPLIDRTIGSFFYIAIAVTSWYGGARPGLVAIVLATLALNVFFLRPLHELNFSDWTDGFRLVLFACVATIINGLSANLRASRQKIEALNQQVAAARESQLREALNAAQMSLWELDLATGVLNWSPEHECLLGFAPGTFDRQLQTFDACVHPDDRASVQQVVDQALQQQLPFQHEFRVVWPDGSVHWLEGRGRAIYDEVGQPLWLTGTTMAIDARKQAQGLLEQQLEQQRLVMEMTNRIRQSPCLPDILQTTVDEVRQFLQVDRVLVLQFNSTWGGRVIVESVTDPTFAILAQNISDPCIGESYVQPFQQGLVTAKADIYSVDMSQCHREFLAQFQVRANLVVPILKDNELWGLLAAHHCTAPRPWQEAEIDWLRQLAAQVGIALQQAALFAQVQTELRERQQAEAALQERESLLRLFAQYAPAGIAMFDRAMRYVMASQRWVDEYHLSAVEAVLGRSHYEIFPELPERWRQIHQRCLGGAIERCEDDLWLRADGQKQWITWEIRPWYTATQAVGGIIIFSVDVSQRKQVEMALRASEARLSLAQTASNSGVWDWDMLADQVFWSPEYYQLYGLNADVQPSYENWLQTIYPDDRDRVHQQQQELLARQATEIRVEYRVLAGEQVRWFADIGQIFWQGETVTRIVGIAIDITQQKHTELALQTLTAQLEQRVLDRTIALQQTYDLLQRFFDAASSARIGLCIQDTDLRFVQVNESLAAINGHSVAAHLGKTPDELMPDLAPLIKPLLQQVLTTAQPILNLELTAPAPSHPAALRYWLGSYFPIVQQQQSEDVVVGVGVMIIDITDRKQAETRLQQQTWQKQLLWSITQSVRRSLDLNEILHTAVTAVRDLLQLDRVAIYRFNANWSGDFIVESVAAGWNKLVEPHAVKVWEDTYLQETQGGRFRNHETLVVADIYAAGLQPCHIELLEQFQARAYAIAPIFLGDCLWGLFAFYHNGTTHVWQDWEIDLLQQLASQLAIAIQQSNLYTLLQTELQERQQTAAVLLEAERRWRSLLDNVQLIVVGLDQSARVNYVNPCFLTLTGFTETEVLGQDWINTFVPMNRRQKVQQVFSEVIHQNAHPYYQDAILIKAGEERLIAWNNTWLRDVSGAVIGTISIGQDITERQKLEKLKDEFIGVVSHELRTPLTAIQMSLGLLKTGVYANKPEKAQRMIEIALKDTHRLVNLVNDILDLERLESGRLTLERSVCAAAELMQQAVDGVQAIAQQQGIVLQVLPTEIQVWAAADSILQTLTNLLSNAIKFSPPHSTVCLQAAQQADYALFQVRDQGRGIPADKLETIFGRFQQVDASDSREKGGTGLGLPICRSIIERHGGKIWAESTLGSGSTFCFTLPLAIIPS
jgi:PAS domain S-box-containing protein